jgi:hypothetical protein
VGVTDLRQLQQFSDKVARLEATRLARRLDTSIPNVTAEFGEVRITKSGANTFEIVGEVRSILDEHDQDDVDAFVLTYRMFVQKRDSVSIASLAKVYEMIWMPTEAAESFKEAKRAVNEYLESDTSLLDGEHVVKRNKLVDIILYGGLAHTEPAKVPTFDAWMRTGVSGFFWAEFYATVKEMLRFLRFFRDLNNAVLVNFPGLEGRDVSK